MLVIPNAVLLLPDTVARPGVVVLDGDKIAAAGPEDAVEVPASTDVLDAGGGYVTPGFIDVHVHGGGGADFMDATPHAVRTVCRFHAAGGTTGLLATTAAAPSDELLRALDVIATVQREGTGGAAILGVHLEGPFLGGAPGAHPVDLLRPADPAWLSRVLDAHPGLVRVVTLAPEADPALTAIR
ncbi:MAG: amidohydrolase family protein, partial [Chloroflexota bacterium]